MAKLKIYTFPDQVLSKVAAPIDRVEKDYQRLADDMLETMYGAPGIGLAANQVGVLKRILVLDTEYETEADEDEEGRPQFIEGREGAEGDDAGAGEGGSIIRNGNPIVIINPKIVYREGSIAIAEGCLSVPEYTSEVKRSKIIKVEYQDIDGTTKTLDAEGLQAVCIQHEMDHLNGKLFVDRLSPAKKMLVKRRLLREREERDDELAEDSKE